MYFIRTTISKGLVNALVTTSPTFDTLCVDVREELLTHTYRSSTYWLTILTVYSNLTVTTQLSIYT